MLALCIFGNGYLKFTVLSSGSENWNKFSTGIQYKGKHCLKYVSLRIHFFTEAGKIYRQLSTILEKETHHEKYILEAILLSYRPCNHGSTVCAWRCRTWQWSSANSTRASPDCLQ